MERLEQLSHRDTNVAIFSTYKKEKKKKHTKTFKVSEFTTWECNIHQGNLLEIMRGMIKWSCKNSMLGSLR